MKKKQITVIIISLIVIVAAIGFSACASGALAGPKSGIESQVQTAAAATVVQYMIETQVAVQSHAMVSEPAVQAQVTEPPVPTPTPVPTQTAQPTVAASPTPLPPTAASSPTPAAAPALASGPKIVADQNTNCRAGPGTGYTIETVFMKGSESSVEGRNAGKNWWYIANPSTSGDFCWVWEGSTTVVGDTSTLDVVEAPAAVYPAFGNAYYAGNYCGNPYVFCDDVYDYYNCGNYPYNYWKLCNPNKNKWKNCNPYISCTCTPVCKNPCKKSNCPPVTIVNYKKYCKNYPQCCGDTGNNLTGN